MIEVAMMWLSDLPAEAAMVWAAGWLLRGSLFIALLVLFALPLARRRSSSVRHLLWVAGFTAAVALPVVSLGVPRWEVTVPPAILPSFSEEGWLDRAPVAGAEPGAVGATAVAEPSGSADVLEAGSDGLRSGAIGMEGGNRLTAPSLSVLLFAIWGAGALFLLLRYGGSVLSLAGIVRRADPASPREWDRTLFDLADRMDLQRAPKLVASDEVVLPMTCGILSPVIVLPRTAEEWTRERLEAVLSHELAHIRRRDLLTHLLGHVGSALYWVNPLTWKAARQLRAESERACDDLVLSLGMRPSEYADHLLQIATTGHRGASPIAALPMARPGEFEQRLLSILAPIGDRGRPRGLQAAVLALGVMVLAVPFAILAPGSASGETVTPVNTVSEFSSSHQGDAGSGSATADGDTLLSLELAIHAPEMDHDPVSHSVDHEVTRHVTPLEHLDVDVRAFLEGRSLASFVESVTSFAGAVAADAIASAFTEVSAEIAHEMGSDRQDRLEGEFVRTLSLSGPLELDISTGSGGIEIREGDVDRIEIRGEVRVGARRRGGVTAEEVLQRLTTSPPIEQRGNSVTIGRIADRDLQEDVSISYEIVVPVRSTISAQTGSGGVTVRGVQGNLEARTGSGSVSLTAIAGNVYARTGSGSIRAAEVDGSFDGETGSGSIELTLQGEGDVSLQTGSGSVQVSGVRGGLRVDTGSGRITARGEMRGVWFLETGSGSVTVDLPSSAAFNLSARTGSGGIDLRHPVTIQGRLDERRREIVGTVRGGGHELNVHTGSGGVVID